MLIAWISSGLYSDADYFRFPARTSSQPSENWVLRQNSLKRLYRLIAQYFTDVLHQQTSALGVPRLQDIAEKYDVAETLALCRLTLAIAVQGPRNKNAIERIQKLGEADQRALMLAIEQVRSCLDTGLRRINVFQR